MSNLIAYIPVLNQQYVNWLQRHPDSFLHLISQKTASSLIPRLDRNMAALDADMMASLLRGSGLIKDVYVGSYSPNLLEKYIMPHDDVSHAWTDRYGGSNLDVQYERIWARWDMSAVLAQQQVIPDVVQSSSPLDLSRMEIARKIKNESPDWFRQIGAVLFDKSGELVAAAYNTHLPNEYEAYIFGDPAINRDAGTSTKISLALHAEQAIIAECARRGISTEGGKLYTTTFTCPDCARVIVHSGISKVFFEDGYSLQNAQIILKSAGIEIIQLKNPESA